MSKFSIRKIFIFVGVVANISVLFILPQSRSVIAAEGGYGSYGGYGEKPNCTLRSEPELINEGEYSKLTASCSLGVKSFIWSDDSCKDYSSATCIVKPSQTTNYSVMGVSSTGMSLPAYTTVAIVAKITPVCLLQVEPLVINRGKSGVVTANCTPVPASYKWLNTYFSSWQNSGVLYPSASITYSVTGLNNMGSSNYAKASLYVCGKNNSGNLNSYHPDLVGSHAISNDIKNSNSGSLFDGKNINTILYDCNDLNFKVVKTNVGWKLVADAEGIDDITGLQGVTAPSISMEFDISKNAGKIYRIYQAAFDREPDGPGLSYWTNYMNYYGMSLQDVANGFFGSNEFKSRYGENLSNENFVVRLYANVLHRAPDQIGYNYWLNLLNSGAISPVDALINFSESQENKVGVINKVMKTIDLVSKRSTIS